MTWDNYWYCIVRVLGLGHHIHKNLIIVHGVRFADIIMTNFDMILYVYTKEAYLHRVGHVRIEATQVTTSQEWHNHSVLTSKAIQHTY